MSFTAAGDFLVASHPTGVRAFQVPGWRTMVLPGVPADTTAVFVSDDGSGAIIVRTNKTTALWMSGTRIPLKGIGKERPAFLASFSPDHKRVAIASSYKNAFGRHLFRVQVFDTRTGQLMHALSPNEMQYMESVEGILWSPDSQYVMGVTKSQSFFTSRNVNVWNADTGRHRGNFVGCPTDVTGLALTPDGRTLICGCWDGKIRFWDFSLGIARVRAFEASLTAQPK